MTRRLSLSKETLVELSTDELSLVQGAALSADCTTTLTLLTCRPPCHTAG